MDTKKVKKMLIDKDMTVKGLAKETGFCRLYISKIINGHTRSPRAEKLIAYVLGCTPSDLC